VKMSLGTRLASSYLVVILIGMGIVAPLAWLAVEQLYLNTQSASLLAQAELVAAALQAQTPVTENPVPYAQTTNVLPGIHTRVIDTKGAVVIDLTATGEPLSTSGLSLPELARNVTGQVTAEELISRPEIAQARLGQSASAIRRVEIAGGRRVLYVAAPVLSSAGEVVQIVYLATPLPDTQWTALPVMLRWQFGFVILAAILLASAAGLLLARRISRPLTRLADAAHAVAAGDLNQVVPEDPAISELAVLGRAFNTMITGLRQSDQTKTAFISDVSHELRTPLTVIKGTIETLEDGALDDHAARGSLLASMSRETERLIRLVNDLLVLTRADAGVLNLQLNPLDLEDLARSRCDHLAKAASQRPVRLIVLTNRQPENPKTSQITGRSGFTIMADADRLAQVLDNLLDNAIRYSPVNGEVQVNVYREADQIACRVTDTGSGIPANHLPFIFERFYRADPSRGRGQGGTGLGLAIVRSLVQAHSGHVSADSIEGQGTSVTFWLPATQNSPE
jgi:signal transduction histidine kinase